MTTEIENVLDNLPDEPWQYCRHLMANGIADEAATEASEPRWLMSAVIFAYDDLDGSYPTEEWEWLRFKLVILREYVDRRRTESAENITRWLTERLAKALPEDYMGWVAEFLAECEDIWQIQIRNQTVDVLLETLPLSTDPIDYAGIMAAYRAWRAEHPLSDDSETDDNGQRPDPHWFGVGDVLRLEKKLLGHPLAVEMLERHNQWLTDPKRKAGKLTMYGVAVVGCLWRKNIRSNQGVVSTKSFETFCQRCQGIVANDRPPHRLQLKAAKQLLMDVGFMRLVKGHDHASGQAAVYGLTNEAEWT